MKSSLLLLLAICLVSLGNLAGALSQDDVGAWEEFKTRFNRTYFSDEEEQLRMKVFIENKQYIESHNRKESVPSFQQGLNALSDLTTEEINRSRCGFRLDAESLALSSPSGSLIESLLFALNTTLPEGVESATNRAWYENILSPEKLDWRLGGRVSKVKDQGSCGSCWSFATTGALESILASRNRSILLSEQNLVDCSRRYGNHGCSGGLMGAAFRYIRDHGIMSSQDYPYTARDGTCRFRRERSVASVRGSIVLPHGNEALLRIVLSLTGPIPVAIDAGAKSFHNYKSGVYDDRVCRNSNGALNHAVLLVGYGTDRVGGDFWLVKNSWGSKWGDNGYIKMARNRRNFCGIASYAVLPIP